MPGSKVPTGGFAHNEPFSADFFPPPKSPPEIASGPYTPPKRFWATSAKRPSPAMQKLNVIDVSSINVANGLP